MNTPHLSRLLLLSILILLIGPSVVGADTVEDIKARIDNQTSQIKQLEAEISQYQKKLTEVGAVTSTLKGEITRIDTTRQKLNTDIKLTETKASAATLSIEQLGIEIGRLEQTITVNRQGIRESLRRIKIAEDDDAVIDVLMTETSLADIFNGLTALNSLQQTAYRQIRDLRQAEAEALSKRQTTESEKKKLLGLIDTLADQKQVVETTRKEKDTLLTQTKSTEAEYARILQEKLAKKQQVEAEIAKAEEALKIIINPKTLPSVGPGVLAWPLDKIIITQYFGNTSFASQNPQVYGGKGHNGVDFGVPVGTPIKAPRQGVVRGFGNTDTVCQAASYGNWILVDHDNGLSTLYAHLSVIKVAAGQSVSTGDIIGYSGNTGYSTGPHLHFSLFATPGVQIGDLKSKVAGCGTYKLPLASYSSYLNPLSYLPAR